jgi:hypothetical protein
MGWRTIISGFINWSQIALLRLAYFLPLPFGVVGFGLERQRRPPHPTTLT